jgi:cytochrome b subunit of formate dehydrogenase
MNVYRRIYKYAVATRLSHWLWVVAFGVLVSSGMQIFNATPHQYGGNGGYWEDQGYEWYAGI